MDIAIAAKRWECNICNQHTCPTEETPLSVLPHLEYCNSFLSPTASHVFSRALKISDCKSTKLYKENHKFMLNGYFKCKLVFSFVNPGQTLNKYPYMLTHVRPQFNYGHLIIFLIKNKKYYKWIKKYKKG